MTSAEDVDYSTVRLKEPMDEEGAASFKVRSEPRPLAMRKFCVCLTICAFKHHCLRRSCSGRLMRSCR